MPGAGTRFCVQFASGLCRRLRIKSDASQLPTDCQHCIFRPKGHVIRRWRTTWSCLCNRGARLHPTQVHTIGTCIFGTAMEERREHDAAVRPDVSGLVQPETARDPSQKDTPMQKLGPESHTSPPPDTTTPHLHAPTVDPATRQDTPRKETERETSHAVEHDSSHPVQATEPHDVGGLDPNNPDVQHQLRQQEMTKLMWLYVPHTHHADPSQKMTSQPTTRTKMRRTRTAIGMSRGRRSTRIAITSSA